MGPNGTKMDLRFKFCYFCRKIHSFMFRKAIILFQITGLLLLSSCRSTRTSFSPVSQSELAGNYVSTYKDLAINEMKRTGVPASITLAQGIIESDYGRSSLAIKANNHFGIKCHTDWDGATFFKNDDKRNECFRKYNNPAQSFIDHSDFLVSGSRYSFLFELDPTDYKSWAKGLKKAGYATNPDYAEMLIRKIEEFNLSVYDNKSDRTENSAKIVALKKDDNNAINEGDSVKYKEESASGETVGYSRIFVRNRIYYIIVREGDTFESLQEEFQLLRFELQKYNELPDDFNISPGQILYIQPKRNKADAGINFHTVNKGETMYEISQLYGIKLKDLLEMNRMLPDEEPVAEQKIWLRSIKPLE
jgi:LysM repeat protein